MNEVYDPFAKGRWYRFFIESDGSEYKLTESDVEGATIDSTFLHLPAGYQIIEKCYQVHSTAAFTLNISLKSYADGSQAASLPAKTGFDYGYFYIFAIKEG